MVRGPGGLDGEQSGGRGRQRDRRDLSGRAPPLLMAGSARQLAAYGGAPVRVLDLATTQDPRDLTQLPTSLLPVRYQIWLTEPGSAGTRDLICQWRGTAHTVKGTRRGVEQFGSSLGS